MLDESGGAPAPGVPIWPCLVTVTLIPIIRIRFLISIGSKSRKTSVCPLLDVFCHSHATHTPFTSSAPREVPLLRGQIPSIPSFFFPWKSSTRWLFRYICQGQSATRRDHGGEEKLEADFRCPISRARPVAPVVGRGLSSSHLHS